MHANKFEFHSFVERDCTSSYKKVTINLVKVMKEADLDTVVTQHED